MLHRFHHDDALVVEGEAEASIGIRGEGLLALRGQNDMDAVRLDPGAGTELRAAAAEAALAMSLGESAHGDAQIEGIAGGDTALAGDAQIERGADPSLVADAHRARIPVQAR